MAARTPREEPDPGLTRAAVAVVLVPSPDRLLLIRRAEHPGDPWSGHIGLPGGRHDPADPDLVATAMRETLEEVALDLAAADLIGALDDLAPRNPTLPPLMVRPFVFRLPEPPPLVPSEEVALAFWSPLDHLTAPDVRAEVTVRHRGAELRLPAYRLPQGTLWGMTERILSPLLELAAPPR